MKMLEIPVLVVGAGPVGLAMALELGYRGIDCLIIDKERDQSSPIHLHPRAAAITPRSMEFCRRWGIAEDIANSGFPRDWDMNIVYCTDMQGPTVTVQKFPAINARKPLKESPELRERCPQIWFDPILERGLARYPSVTIRRGWNLVDFQDNGARVVVHIETEGSDERVTVQCQYLVACDGGTSAIRNALGIDTEGDGVLSYSVNAVIDIPDFITRHNKGPAERYMFIDGRGVFSELTVIDGRDRWRLGYAGSEEALDRSGVDMEALARKMLGDGVPFNIVTISPWKRRESIARRFSKGRVFLAGDAAHAMPPNLGMGMNTGLGDVVNLGWKIQAALEGWAGADLLDTYDLERRPAATHIAKTSTATYRKWMTPSEDYRHANAPGVEGELARQRSADYINSILGEGWDTLGLQLGYRFDDSPICIPDGTPRPPPAESLRDYNPTSRPGAHAPHVYLEDGVSILSRFGKGFKLLRFKARELDVTSVLKAAASVGMPLEVVDVDEDAAAACYETKLVLVRPDSHVSWRGDALPDDARNLVDAIRGASAT